MLKDVGQKGLNVTLIISGVLGEDDLAAQHVLLELGTLSYMVCNPMCSLEHLCP